MNVTYTQPTRMGADDSLSSVLDSLGNLTRSVIDAVSKKNLQEREIDFQLEQARIAAEQQAAQIPVVIKQDLTPLLLLVPAAGFLFYMIRRKRR